MSAAPAFWVKKVESAIEEMKLIPLWGSPPPFPWEEFTEKLKEALNLPKLELSLQKTEWKEKEELLSGMGDQPILSSCLLSPIATPLFFVMPQEDAFRLSAYALSPEQETRGFTNPHFQEGFYRFLLLHVLDTISQLNPFPSLSLKLASKTSLPEEGALAHEIKIKLGRKVLWARVLIPSSFHEAFRVHFSQERPPLLESPLTHELPLSLHAEVGSVNLKVHEWQKLGIGDLLILDRCTFDPDEQKGSAVLVLDKTPLFQARYKHDQIKIVDYAFYYEENMDTSNESGEETPGEELSEEEAKADESHLWSTKSEGREEDVEKLLSAEEIPLTLTVELGRVTLPLDKLLKLAPGNLVELPTKPEQGVSLTIHGKRVAKGELVKLGEVIGVKILEIGE